MKDFYYILGTAEDCSFDDIKEAYRKLSKKFHPDLNQNDKYFENRFRAVQEAYETLSDPVKRARYDAAMKRPAPGGPNYGHQNARHYYTYNAQKRHDDAGRSAAYKPKTRLLDISFTVILIAITLIFGDYVFRSMTGTSRKEAKKTLLAGPAIDAPVKRHKKKHIKLIARQSKPVMVVKTGPPRYVSPEVSPLAQTGVPAVKPAADSISQSLKPAYLYAAYVRSNVTGIINMRGSADFGSEVIQTIPSNSKVLVLAKDGSYDKVQFGRSIGYVPNWTLEER